MALAVDVYSGPGGTGTNGRSFSGNGAASSLSFSNFANLSAGDTGFLVFAAISDNSGGLGTLTAKWDNAGTPQTMTSLGSAVNSAGDCIEAFFLVNPTAGQKQLGFTWNGPDVNQNITCLGIAFSGGITTSVAAATEGYATGNSTTPAAGPATATTGVSIPTGDLAFAGFIANGNGASLTTSNGTNVDNDSSNPASAWSQFSGAGSTITGNCTLSISDAWAAIIVGVKAAAAAGGGGTLPMMGVGYRRQFEAGMRRVRWQCRRSGLIVAA